MSSAAAAITGEESDPKRNTDYTVYLESLHKELTANWSGGYAQMPHVVRNDSTLSQKCKIVYEQLLSYMWFGSDTCWPSQETIAKATGYSRRTVIRALNELYERGYIEKYRRGQGDTNRYFINPLSFTRSFRPIEHARTATRLPHNNVLLADAPALRQDVTSAQSRPAEPFINRCQNDTSRSDNESQQEASECHTNYTKLNGNGAKEHGEPNSSGSATASEARAIRTTLNPAKLSNPQSSNPPVIEKNEKERGAAAAKDDKLVEQQKRSPKWEAHVQANGIPLDALHELEQFMDACPRPERHPMVVEMHIELFSKEWNNAHVLASNKTQATKLYHYARSKGIPVEVLDDLFREWLLTAHDGVPVYIKAKMAWFFRSLKLQILKALCSDLPYQQRPATSSPIEHEDQALDPGRHIASRRSIEERKARELYAKGICSRLEADGVVGTSGLFVVGEHVCGCCLYHGDWLCAHCSPDSQWNPEVQALIATILEQ
jgi:DNA-binding transcriptional ArsR family regulator